MESELERAKVRLNSAQDALMDAQLTWAHAHRDWLQAVNNSARGVVSEGATSGTACACGACVACGVKEWADEVHAKVVNAEKRVEGVGPHTSPRASGGCACQRNHCYGCDWGTSATHHATHATHVPATKGHDTTSHR